MISRLELCGRLLAFYLGRLIVGRLIAIVTSGVVVLGYFNDGNTVSAAPAPTRAPAPRS
jgi:hypothetical protein